MHTRTFSNINTRKQVPEWNSKADMIKLSIGKSDFTCCQRNHVVRTKTSTEETKEMEIPCDKLVACKIIETMVSKRISELFALSENLTLARFHVCLTWWFTFNLEREDEEEEEKSDDNDSIDDLKNILRWNTLSDDGDWFDCNNISVLFYAVLSNKEETVRLLLENLRKERNTLSDSEFNRKLCFGTGKQNCVEFSIPGNSTTLHIAMLCGNLKIIEMLLQSGANISAKDMAGNDPFFSACVYGHVSCVKYWLKTFPEYCLNSCNAKSGAGALRTWCSSAWCSSCVRAQNHSQ